ncbi:MAG: ATP-binding cassette domain-containing protein [Jatrophihabitans sp.]|uniref:ATP-binding cassette domain-containing protein n=1 Tax=Jatrophihabitans sp. TaxID=1932789 RepID=UPI0039137791
MIRRAGSYLGLMAATVGRGAVARLLALQLLVAVTEGAGLTLLAPILQSVSGRDDLTVPGLGIDLTVTRAFVLVIVVVCIRAFGQWRVAVRSVDIRLITIDGLRLRLLDDLYTAEWRYLAGQRRSHIVQRLTTEVERAQSALVTLLNMIVSALVLAATVAVAILITPLLGGLTALALVIVAGVSRRSIRSSSVLGRTMNERTETFGAAVTDSLSSIRLMRAHDASATWSKIVADEARRFREVRRAFVLRSSAVMAGLGVIVVLAVLVLILIGRASGLSFAALAALAVIATRILGAAQVLMGSLQNFANDSPALDRLTEFGREASRHSERRTEPAGSAPTPTVTGAPLLSLRNVAVRYQEQAAPVFSSVSLDVPRGGLVTLTGASGAGKSTLLDVVLGLLAPDEGEVLVDGAPLRDLAGWRARLGYVPQQTLLVPGSMLENLTWSLPPGRNVDEAQVWAALRGACLDDVVAALPSGLGTVLHESAELSGGEQQRLSIARALLRQPELLLLDEATSALDGAIEQRVLEHLLDSSRAVILVTHRITEHARTRATIALHLENGSLRPA